jgi:hypothetical protein
MIQLILSMIVSKPKFNTFFALGIFLVLVYGVIAYMLYDISVSDAVSLWLYILLVLVAGIALTVTIKFIQSYKVIRLEKNRADVHMLFGLIKKRLYFKELEQWQEERVKTSNGIFKQLTVNFINKGRLRLSNQEHDNYDKVIGFFRKTYGKKEIRQRS